MFDNQNIIALATPQGNGAIGVIRISGPDAITLTSNHFKSKSGKPLTQSKTHSIHLGDLTFHGEILDEVLVSIFKEPKSYTGENVVEISCHGSEYIQQKIIQGFLSDSCRLAKEGEFTLRAFLNGKMDLSQAEGVADLIASKSAASHQIALNQMRGHYSNEIKVLRQELLNLASLMELELDFSEEDVEFANRDQLYKLLEIIEKKLNPLIQSFEYGYAVKKGIPVAILGKPNAGKSTLLNAIAGEEKAIVSEIAGTTRDVIEDEVVYKGLVFRFLDTAGLRETSDVVEKIGIEKTKEKAHHSSYIILLIDCRDQGESDFDFLKDKIAENKLIKVYNKIDLISTDELSTIKAENPEAIFISSLNKIGVWDILDKILDLNFNSQIDGQVVISNLRHFESLKAAKEAILTAKKGLQNELSTDLLSIDIREVLNHLGSITGEVTNDELLGNIFSNFCIGK